MPGRIFLEQQEKFCKKTGKVLQKLNGINLPLNDKLKLRVQNLFCK